MRNGHRPGSTRKTGCICISLLDDNPSLPQEVKERYENMYSGVFRDRHIPWEMDGGGRD